MITGFEIVGHAMRVLGRVIFAEAVIEEGKLRGDVPGQQEEAQLASQDTGDDRDPTGHSNGDGQGGNMSGTKKVRRKCLFEDLEEQNRDHPAFPGSGAVKKGLGVARVEQQEFDLSS